MRPPRATTLALLVATTAALTGGPAPFPAPAARAAPDQISFHTLAQYGGTTQAVAVDGDTIYAGVGPRIAALRVAPGGAVELLGQTEPLRGVVRGLSVRDGIALAALITGEPTALGRGRPRHVGAPQSGAAP